MAESARVGVFLCQGGHGRAESLDYKRLRWAAQTDGVHGVYEITQACQDSGAEAMARLAREHGLDSILLGACPLAGSSGPWRRVLKQLGLDSGLVGTVDLCRKPEGRSAPARWPRARTRP